MVVLFREVFHAEIVGVLMPVVGKFEVAYAVEVVSFIDGLQSESLLLIR